MNQTQKLAVNALRALSIDQVQQANSGHPGAPLGAAPAMYSIWSKYLKVDPTDPTWINRDRFVLSIGHASALYYSMLHLMGFDVSMEDLKQFRQFESKTPGHPEYGHTVGVEATTGPLGAGLSTAVGMAMAQAHMAATYNKENYELFNNFTYVMVGDGDMMEGITSEASSLAGTLKLGRLIVLYDSNNITIEGNTDIAFVENTRQRYEAYGFETFLVEDGNDVDAIQAAIAQGKQNLDQPTFIEIRTKIGYASHVEGSEKSHGAPLGLEGVVDVKKALDYPSVEPFFVPESVYDHYQEIAQASKTEREAWDRLFEAYAVAYPEASRQLTEGLKPVAIETLLEDPSFFEFENKPIATRTTSGIVLNRLNEKFSNLFGGSADLKSSNMTHLEGESSFGISNYAGKNIHFGVREHAMAAMGNGIALYGGLKPYVATFFVFSDFLKPMARLSSLMNVPLTYVLTHDSIGVGEDGPTHEPVEQLTMLRSQPNFYTFRPADGKETAYGWALAVTSQKTPVGLILSRQNLPQLETTGAGALKGAYVLRDPKSLDVILMASGSEVELALNAADALEAKGIGARVVSVPCMELFDEQDQAYKDSVLPNQVRARIAIEAGSKVSWGQYVGLDGAYVTLDHFGGSAPGATLFEAFGFTVENVVQTAESIL